LSTKIGQELLPAREAEGQSGSIRGSRQSGPPGTRKSFLAQAIGYQANKQRAPHPVSLDLRRFQDFVQNEVFEGQDRILSKYLKPDLLIADDMGMEKLPRLAGEIIFAITMRRYETRSTMITSNRPLEDCGKLIGGTFPAPPRISIGSCITPRSSPSTARVTGYGTRKHRLARRPKIPNQPTCRPAPPLAESPNPKQKIMPPRWPPLANRNTFRHYSTSLPGWHQPANRWAELTCRLT
jgi:hypothetical protein